MTRLLGCDFSSSPSMRKSIVLAWGAWRDKRLVLEGLQACTSLVAFEQALHTPGPWVGGFDLPFGLPRELVTTLKSSEAVFSQNSQHIAAALQSLDPAQHSLGFGYFL